MDEDIKALVFSTEGIWLLPTCTDPECVCVVDLLARLRPAIKIVPVKIEVTE